MKVAWLALSVRCMCDFRSSRRCRFMTSCRRDCSSRTEEIHCFGRKSSYERRPPSLEQPSPAVNGAGWRLQLLLLLLTNTVLPLDMKQSDEPAPRFGGSHIRLSARVVLLEGGPFHGLRNLPRICLILERRDVKRLAHLTLIASHHWHAQVEDKLFFFCRTHVTTIVSDVPLSYSR